MEDAKLINSCIEAKLSFMPFNNVVFILIFNVGYLNLILLIAETTLSYEFSTVVMLSYFFSLKLCKEILSLSIISPIHIFSLKR